MSDLSMKTIKDLFQKQIQDVTMQTAGVNQVQTQIPSETHYADLFDFQMSGSWT